MQNVQVRQYIQNFCSFLENPVKHTNLNNDLPIASRMSERRDLDVDGSTRHMERAVENIFKASNHFGKASICGGWSLK